MRHAGKMAGKSLLLPLRVFSARPRLLLALLAGLLIAQVLPWLAPMRTLTAYVIGWNGGAWLYLLLTSIMMARSDSNKIRLRAVQQSEGARLILALVALSAVVCLLAIIAELSVAKDMHGAARIGHIGLGVLTIASSWLFTQTMFALHYAHEYFLAQHRNRPPGLAFPGDETPDYGDFFYFAAVIGTSGQTADISFTSRPMRRIGTLHCILSFAFNTTLLALMINIAAGLL